MWISSTNNTVASLVVQDGTTIDLRPHLRDGMTEAVDIATNAHEVIDRFSGVEKVQSIIRIVLGDNPVKLQRAKGKHDLGAQFPYLLAYVDDLR
jgi:hypothetical protein